MIESIENINALQNEAISASESIVFGDSRLINKNILRLKSAMDQINEKNLYFTRLAILEEMELILSEILSMDNGALSLAYLHYEYSNNSQSALNI